MTDSNPNPGAINSVALLQPPQAIGSKNGRATFTDGEVALLNVLTSEVRSHAVCLEQLESELQWHQESVSEIREMIRLAESRSVASFSVSTVLSEVSIQLPSSTD